MAVIIALSSFALILISIGGGLFLRYKLPDYHLSGDPKDVIRLATAPDRHHGGRGGGAALCLDTQ